MSANKSVGVLSSCESFTRYLFLFQGVWGAYRWLIANCSSLVVPWELFYSRVLILFYSSVLVLFYSNVLVLFYCNVLVLFHSNVLVMLYSNVLVLFHSNVLVLFYSGVPFCSSLLLKSDRGKRCTTSRLWSKKRM